MKEETRALRIQSAQAAMYDAQTVLSGHARLKVSRNMGGKMKGIGCLSTSPLLNSRCETRRKNGDSVCAHCYSQASMWKQGLSDNLGYNHGVLTGRPLTTSEILRLDLDLDSIFRFEAFGDLENEMQMLNYMRIAESYPMTTFALWTKNIDIVDKAVWLHKGRPDNLIIIYSSPIVDRIDWATYHKYIRVIDHIFTVYSTAEEYNKSPGYACAAKSCAKCQFCYRQENVGNQNIAIKELLRK